VSAEGTATGIAAAASATMDDGDSIVEGVHGNGPEG
jgi:hypothetical protein